MRIQKEYVCLFSSLIEAGRLAQELQKSGNFEVEEKTSQTDIVTKADKEVSIFLTREIKKYFPEDLIISEEDDQRETQVKITHPYYWLIDPIDGTWNFRNSIPLWSPMMARVVRGQVEAAALYYPADEILYVAQAGQGLWALKNSVWSQVFTVQHKQFEYSVGHLPMEYDETTSRLKLHKAFVDAHETHHLKLRALSHANAGLSGLFVALGHFHWNLLIDSSLWDYAPIVLFAREVGLCARTFDGEDWNPLAKNSHTLLLGNETMCTMLTETVLMEFKRHI